jgi:hypothetical protein
MSKNKMNNGMIIIGLLLSGVPIVGFMLGFMGMVPLPVYVFVPIIPMLLILAMMTIMAKTKSPDFFNKIISSIWIGFLGTTALDIFRIMSVKIGWLPMDVPLALGAKIVGMDPMKMDMDQWMIGPWLAGNIYHYLIGISFTLVYILLVGKGSAKLGILFGILIWLGMMVLPPMPMMVGFFGLKTGGIGLAFGTLVAHIAYGLVAGLLAKRFVHSKGLLL